MGISSHISHHYDTYGYRFTYISSVVIAIYARWFTYISFIAIAAAYFT